MASVELPGTPATATATAAARSASVPKSLQEETGYLLRRAYVEAGNWSTAAMPENPSPRGYEVLQSLADLGPCSQRALSDLLWINRTIMVKLIDELESAGLVERRRDPADRRSYALELTCAGEQSRAHLSEAADEAETGLTAALSGAEGSRGRTLLSAIAAGTDAPLELPRGLAGRVGFLLTPAHHRVRDLVNERLHALGITTALYGTLATIRAGAPMSQQQIAAQLGLTGPAIVQTVDRLQDRGLVERRRDPADRRSYALEPTERGRATVDDARAAIADVNDQLDGILGGQHQRRELNSLLRKLLRQEPGASSVQ